MIAKGVYGIKSGDPVVSSGSEIGIVNDIEKFKDDSVLIVLRINDTVNLSDDSKFTITNSSLLGYKIIKVEKGNDSNKFLRNGDTVISILRPDYQLDSLFDAVLNK